jgi:hypothetical protein
MLSDGRIQLSLSSDQLCLTQHGNTSTGNPNVIVAPCASGAPEQTWQWQQQQLVNNATGFCLDSQYSNVTENSSGNLETFACHKANKPKNQAFEITTSGRLLNLEKGAIVAAVC